MLLGVSVQEHLAVMVLQRKMGMIRKQKFIVVNRE